MFDRRRVKWFLQRRRRGFDDRETWNLDTTIAEFILPRLRVFKQHNNGHPPNLKAEEWDATIDDMLHAMEYWQTQFSSDDFADRKHRDRAIKGTRLLGEYFPDLWW